MTCYSLAFFLDISIRRSKAGNLWRDSQLPTLSWCFKLRRDLLCNICVCHCFVLILCVVLSQNSSRLVRWHFFVMRELHSK